VSVQTTTAIPPFQFGVSCPSRHEGKLQLDQNDKHYLNSIPLFTNVLLTIPGLIVHGKEAEKTSKFALP
jgi:hypothetical protein